MADLVEFWSTGPLLPASPYAFVDFNGADIFAKINSSTGDLTNGFGTTVLIDPVKGLQIENSKQTWFVIARALSQSLYTNFTRALKSVEYGLQFRNGPSTVNGITYTGPVGSFPAQSNGSHTKQERFHNKSMAGYAYAMILYFAKQSAWYTGADAIWIDTLIGQLADYTYWMADDSPNSNLNKFFERKPPANQQMTVCGYIQMAGLLHDDPDLTALARSKFQQLFDNSVSADGVFYEKYDKDGVGFDGSYQGFSLQNLANAVLIEGSGVWHDLYREKLELGTTRWLQTIYIPDGSISYEYRFITDTIIVPNVWTRVRETYPSKPGLFPKGWNWDNFSYRIEELNYVLGNGVVPADLADKVTTQGRAFGHINGEFPESRLYIVLNQSQIDTVKGLSSEVDWAALAQAPRVGGGACSSYPGGTLPNPVYVISDSVLYQTVHDEHKTYLSGLPILDILVTGFPPSL
jgi:hypothetical protein